MEIDPNAGEPVWSQLASILREEITSGRIAPGKLLPSMRTLQQTHGVSDGTVKRALAKLRQEGLIKSVPGRGTYVALGQGKVRRRPIGEG